MSHNMRLVEGKYTSAVHISRERLWRNGLVAVRRWQKDRQKEGGAKDPVDNANDPIDSVPRTLVGHNECERERF